jgi:hypothetical protein
MGLWTKPVMSGVGGLRAGVTSRPTNSDEHGHTAIRVGDTYFEDHPTWLEDGPPGGAAKAGEVDILRWVRERET